MVKSVSQLNVTSHYRATTNENFVFAPQSKFERKTIIQNLARELNAGIRSSSDPKQIASVSVKSWFYAPLVQRIRLIYRVVVNSTKNSINLAKVAYGGSTLVVTMLTIAIVRIATDVFFENSWYKTTRISFSALVIGSLVTHLNSSIGMRLLNLEGKRVSPEAITKRITEAIIGGFMASLWTQKDIFWEGPEISPNFYILSTLVGCSMLSHTLIFSKKTKSDFVQESPGLISYLLASTQTYLLTSAKLLLLMNSMPRIFYYSRASLPTA